MSARVRAWGPALLWCVVIFALSSIPGRKIPQVPSAPDLDKLVHAFIYVVLGALCYRGVRASFPTLSLGRAVAVAALLGTLYGVSDELHQSFTPQRSPDWHDAAADAIGSLAGAFGAAKLAARRARR